MTDLNARSAHWQAVYDGKQPQEVSWYQETPEPSLSLIGVAVADRHAPIVDVGGGASRLVDALIGAGFGDVTVLDIAANALAAARVRLGTAGDAVHWIVADVTSWRPTRRYALWHDRAVFHFLTDAADRSAYVRALDGGLTDGGTAVIGTFAPDGPEKCSGLPVVRYDETTLAEALGPRFRVAEAKRDVHVTPAGREQAFIYFDVGRAD